MYVRMYIVNGLKNKRDPGLDFDTFDTVAPRVPEIWAHHSLSHMFMSDLDHGFLTLVVGKVLKMGNISSWLADPIPCHYGNSSRLYYS